MRQYNQLMNYIIVLLLASVCLSYKIGKTQKTHKITSLARKGQLGFSNQTGDGITQQMKEDIINLINGASGFYDDDVESNMLYLKLVLDRLYGTDDQKFFIYIQTQPTVFGYIVSSTEADILIGLTEVNIINPSWSYLIIRSHASPNIEDYAYLKYPKTGKGITDNVRAFIVNTIDTYETDEVNCCTLYTLDIVHAIEKKFSYDLNLICDEEGVTQGLVMPYKQFWGTFKGNKCEYSLFADK